MAEISYINPLSNEGREIIKDYGDLNQLEREDEYLIEEVIHTTNQKISDDSLIPKSYKDLAFKRMQWAIEKKNNKNYNQNEFEFLLNDAIFKQDVVIFHVLCQAIAIQFNTGSREARLFIESQGVLIQERLAKLTPATREEIIDEILDEIKTDGSIKWSSLKDVIATKKLKLSELLIQDGDIILQQDEFLNNYADEFTDRSPDRMYNILVGDSVKELILSRLIMQKTEEYIARIKEMSKRVEMHPEIVKLSEELKEFIPEEISKYNQYYAGSGGIYGTVQAGKLIPEAKHNEDIINAKPFPGKVIALKKVTDGAVRYTKGGTRQNKIFAESVMSILDELSKNKNADFTIRINTDRTELLETRVIDGKKYLVIEHEDGVMVNGIPVGR